MFKTGMGNVTDYNYAAEMTPEFKEMIDRMRYDVSDESRNVPRPFHDPLHRMVQKLSVLSRAQAYGRGFFRWEAACATTFQGESWTTNWLQHRIGERCAATSIVPDAPTR
ncbi:MAG: hypothetical protein ACLR8Y_08810 [Alistipes indistinctus]